jgi:hypothetical protein
MQAPPALTATVTVSPAAPDPLCRTLSPNSPPTSSAASALWGVKTFPQSLTSTKPESVHGYTRGLSRVHQQSI